MDMRDFYDKIGDIFLELKIPTPEFEYNPETLEYYSTELVTIDGFDYIIVVTEDGRVLYGEVEGDDFFEEGILGCIYL